MKDRDNENLGSRDDQAIDALVRTAIARNTDTDFKHPDENTILAYLSGNATENEIVLMRDLLVTSVSFRKELLEIAADFERLQDPVRSEFFDRVEVDGAPICKTEQPPTDPLRPESLNGNRGCLSQRCSN